MFVNGDCTRNYLSGNAQCVYYMTYLGKIYGKVKTLEVHLILILGLMQVIV